ALVCMATALVVSTPVLTQQRPPAQPAAQGSARDWGSSGEIHTFHVQGNVHLVVGAGGNIAVQTGSEGVLFVDTGLAQHGEKVLSAVRKDLSDKPIRWIVNTHFHADHVGGNEIVGKAGSTTQGNPTAIVAHENVLNRMSLPGAGQTPIPTAAWPTSSYVKGTKDFFFNDEPVMVYHARAAHTDGDSVVLFRRSDVILTGDLWDTTKYPRIDHAGGGGVQGLIDGLNLVLDLAVPKHEQEGGTFVVPGHGRVGDEADVLEYRDMVTIVRDRIADMVARKQTLAQATAARPTLDYDRQYGATSGSWTTAMFIEAIYQDLSKSGADGGAK
ncbi:MAG TPA: MBL fold metallo-hydrolase, partial [Vicinamibacterales bacterium]